jgi:predicted Rossmann fold flavoprotein
LNKHFSVLTIGGGAAGMMAAGIAAQNGCPAALLERNPRVGRKLMITGKGRCNITNDCEIDALISHIPSNGRFLYSAFHRFSSQDTIRFFEEQGVPTKTERGNRVFPQSDKAADVVDALRRFVKKSGCSMLHGRAKSLIIENDQVIGVVTEEGRTLSADAVIIACGGLSYPGTGSTGDGYELARQAGHTIVPPVPSLVPLIADEPWCKRLQGLSLRNIAIKVEDQANRKTVYKDFGELLFTHFGLSGPVILSASAHMRPMERKRYRVDIDLKPALSIDQLDLRLQRDFAQFSNRDFMNSLQGLLPRKLIPVAVELSTISPSTKCNQITKDQRIAFAALLKNLSVTVDGFRPVEEAIVTSGGVAVSEINPKTMESKRIKGLYFAGEVLDLDAYTGGFNLQIAFSTGWVAGNSASGGY